MQQALEGRLRKSISDFLRFCKRRERRRLGGKVNDSILERYHFTNIRHCDDPMSKWVMENLNDSKGPPHEVIFNISFFRFLNNIAFWKRAGPWFTKMSFDRRRILRIKYAWNRDFNRKINDSYQIEYTLHQILSDMEQFYPYCNVVSQVAYNTRSLRHVSGRMKSHLYYEDSLILGTIMQDLSFTNIFDGEPCDMKEFYVQDATTHLSLKMLNFKNKEDSSFRITSLRHVMNDRLQPKRKFTNSNVISSLREWRKYHRIAEGQIINPRRYDVRKK